MNKFTINYHFTMDIQTHTYTDIQTHMHIKYQYTYCIYTPEQMAAIFKSSFLEYTHTYIYRRFIFKQTNNYI